MTQYINIKHKNEQDKVINIIKKYNVFLTGLPGSGKTHLTRTYIKYCYDNHLIVGITASTGIASKLLENDMYSTSTIHSWSGIDIIEKEDSYEKILNRVLQKKFIVNRWRKTNVLIIDEISLIDNKIFSFLDKIAKHIRGNKNPFGGIRLLIVGDFYQLPPVNGNFCFTSDIWDTTFDYNINLKTSYRSNDTNMNKILNTIRRGKLLKPNMIQKLKNRNISLEETSLEETSLEEKSTHCYPIMVPLRDMARNINNNMMKENTNIIFKSNAVYNNDSNIKNIMKLSPLEDELILKVGCPVIFLVNCHNKGLMNGMVGTVVDFKDGKPVVMFPDLTNIYIIEKHIWEKVENNKVMRMEQFPLLLSYAITIHRAQGQTLSQASIILNKNVWERSQAYVALSRLQSLKGLNLLDFDINIFNKFNTNDMMVSSFYKKFNKKYNNIII